MGALWAILTSTVMADAVQKCLPWRNQAFQAACDEMFVRHTHCGVYNSLQLPPFLESNCCPLSENVIYFIFGSGTDRYMTFFFVHSVNVTFFFFFLRPVKKHKGQIRAKAIFITNNKSKSGTDSRRSGVYLKILFLQFNLHNH